MTVISAMQIMDAAAAKVLQVSRPGLLPEP